MAQPTTNDPNIVIDLVAGIPGNGIRLAFYERTGLLYMLARDGGVWTIDPESGSMKLAADATDHGIGSPQGFALTPDGIFYLTGNIILDKVTTGVVARGTAPPGMVAPTEWETIVTTVPYPLSADFNHLWNATVVDPRGNYLYVNSGSRTDHGEVQDNLRAHPGRREVPITSAILRFPTDASGIELENDEAFLRDGGYLFADGARNHFDLAFDADGQLFGVENSGDRDDEDEFNWLRKGRHYGFPWRMGTHDTPQQFPGYDPSSDPLINPLSTAAQLGLFEDDPDFPERPAGVEFFDPVPNRGPNLARLRNPETGEIEDAAVAGATTGTFTPHVTPVGLTFDVEDRLAEPYARDGFVLAWTGDDSDLFGPFGDVGEALFHLDPSYDLIGGRFTVETTRIVEGFEMPLDAVLVDTTLFVMEIRFGPDANLWALRFPGRERIDPTVSNPIPLREDVTVERLRAVPFDAVRISYDPSSNALLILSRSGDIDRYNTETRELDRVATSADHGVPTPRGLAIGSGNRLFLLGNDVAGNTTAGIVRRAVLQDGIPHSWETVATTDRYPLAGNQFDHLMNELALSPDGRRLFISSGSRTDHGEIQTNGEAFPELREVPLTATLLRIPADTVEMVIPGDEQALLESGWVHARGLRNAFDLGWAPGGHLFGAENSGERDDPDELNWIRAGKHYGFPWLLGGNETPQRHVSYDPEEDPLIAPGAARVFANDPTYPEVPAGVVFEHGVANVGPDANFIRDPATGVLIDAGDWNLPVRTFTPHRSPLGLAFDTAGALAEPFAGDGFVLSWTGGDNPLLRPLRDEGQDLLHLDLMLDGGDSTYSVSATQIVKGFRRPVDAVLVGSELNVIETGFSESENPSLWLVRLPEASGSSASDPGNVLPAAHSFSVFPNPVSSEGRLQMTLVEAGHTTVALYDIRGRMAGMVVDRFFPAGTHVTPFSVGSLSPGVYIARMVTNGNVGFHPIVRAD